jgi:hypothetical protein
MRYINIYHRHTNGRHVSEDENLEGHEKDKAEIVKELYQMVEVLQRAEFRCREMVAIAERDSNESRDKIQTLEREVQSIQFQFHTKIEELETEHRHYGELVESTRRHGERMQAAKEELRIAEAHHMQTRHLLEERTTELAGAQRFLTQTDSLSGADAIALAESLNAEILQAAAYMADSLEFSYSQTPSNIEQKNRRVPYILGESIMQVLESRRGQDATGLDPTPVQIALQVAMVYCSTKIIDLWVQDDKGNETLINIFSRIAEKGTFSESCMIVTRTTDILRGTSGLWEMALHDPGSCHRSVDQDFEFCDELRRQRPRRRLGNCGMGTAG